ncbi:uncharacterized protein LOC127593467 isoform X6 [Hippocampus zosterae]|uniref:uncharacterized protein LOC127593467 isoform X6 n=1 Tax=Hippocampus zosterae TaxID=109293 RepID=UPI00223D99A4|nr:uncharacterized protein LOC127593467 isoform X6 [Hippocampus zosterae]
MASTNAPAGADDDKARKGESNGGRNSVLQAGDAATGAMPNSGKSVAETPPPTRSIQLVVRPPSAAPSSSCSSPGPPRPGAGGRLPPGDVRQRAQTSAILLVASRRGAGLVAVSLRDTFGPSSSRWRPGRRCIGASGQRRCARGPTQKLKM